MSNFKVGDRVRVYEADREPWIGVVQSLFQAKDMLIVDGYNEEDISINVYTKQCRKLKPKSPPRERWFMVVNDNAWFGFSTKEAADDAAKFQRESGRAVDVFLMREVKKGK